jgi:SAM-dependent methyltransferase
VPESTTAGDIAAVQELAPSDRFPRLVDVGCGTGRTACRLVECGYDVTGIDTSVEALTTARRLCDWLAANPQSETVDEQGATINRWVRDGRCFHQIRYRDGSSDAIEFNVYRPEEITGMLSEAGFQVDAERVWWKAEISPGPGYPRYQMVCSRR